MPTYEYCCDACGHVFEEFQFLSEAPISECPECGADSVSKMVSAPVPLTTIGDSAPACGTDGACPIEPDRTCAGGACPFGA